MSFGFVCFYSLQLICYSTSTEMASSFTRLMSGRGTAVLLASLGAGTMATGFLLSENSSLAAEARKKLYPPR